jgi:hypothetical protein
MVIGGVKKTITRKLKNYSQDRCKEDHYINFQILFTGSVVGTATTHPPVSATPPMADQAHQAHQAQLLTR